MEYYKNLDLADIKYFCEFDQIDKIEEWKDIPDYEGIYQVSDLGRVKSISRFVVSRPDGIGLRRVKERILKPVLDNFGYFVVGFSANCKSCNKQIHQIVAMAFLNHIPGKIKNIVVDHKDNVKTNNYKGNLQLITVRQNSSKDQFRRNKSSKYVGVSWHKAGRKWSSCILINKKKKYLGSFHSELEAHEAYQKALTQLNEKSH